MKNLIFTLSQAIITIVSVIALAIVSFYLIHSVFSFTAAAFNGIGGLSFSDAFQDYWNKQYGSSAFTTCMSFLGSFIYYLVKTDEI
jgi:ABC-type phosphate transport system permease subunit